MQTEHPGLRFASRWAGAYNPLVSLVLNYFVPEKRRITPAKILAIVLVGSLSILIGRWRMLAKTTPPPARALAPVFPNPSNLQTSFFLIARTKELTASVFNCPSTQPSVNPLSSRSADDVIDTLAH